MHSPAAAAAAFPSCCAAWTGRKGGSLMLLHERRAQLRGLAGMLVWRGLQLTGQLLQLLIVLLVLPAVPDQKLL